MENINNKIGLELNRLIMVNFDSKLTFENAARIINNQSYNEVFLYLAKEKESFIELLKMQICNLGLRPAENGSLQGRLLLAAMNLKSLLFPNDIQLITKSCMAAELLAINKHKEVLNEYFITDNIEFIIETQLHKMETLMNNIHIMQFVVQYQ